MSDYCTGCRFLGKEVETKDDYCGRAIPAFKLFILCGNPKKHKVCKSDNWYKDKGEFSRINEANKAAKEFNNLLRDVLSKQLKQKEKTMDTKEMIAVLQAYVNGEQIQFAAINVNRWTDLPKMDNGFDFIHFNYRIKPEPKYRPLKQEELVKLKGKWLKNKQYDVLKAITGIDICDNRVCLNGCEKSAIDLFNHWTYEDGTPVGVLE